MTKNPATPRRPTVYRESLTATSSSMVSTWTLTSSDSATLVASTRSLTRWWSSWGAEVDWPCALPIAGAKQSTSVRSMKSTATSRLCSTEASWEPMPSSTPWMPSISLLVRSWDRVHTTRPRVSRCWTGRQRPHGRHHSRPPPALRNPAPPIQGWSSRGGRRERHLTAFSVVDRGRPPRTSPTDRTSEPERPQGRRVLWAWAEIARARVVTTLGPIGRQGGRPERRAWIRRADPSRAAVGAAGPASGRATGRGGRRRGQSDRRPDGTPARDGANSTDTDRLSECARATSPLG